jgi:[acyl-carrier-protein] S-malonyltransferase
LMVIGNVQASLLGTSAEIRADLEAQLTSRVRWTESVRAMVGAGVTAFFEVGTGDVLSGLIRRTEKSVGVHTLDQPASFAALAA